MSDGVSYRVEHADVLSSAERMRLGELIVSGFPLADRYIDGESVARWRCEAWRTTPALLHCVAYLEKVGTPVAQQSLFRLSSPGIVVFGLGDMVVSEPFRGRGIARALIEMAVSQAREAGAEAICTRTTKLATVFRGLGFVSDEQGMLFTSEQGEPLPYLMAWTAPGLSIRSAALTPSDF